MRVKLLMILMVFIYSCSNGGWNGEWGATTSNNDEFCTIYWTVQLEIFKTHDINDKNFPDRELRDDHIKETPDGHKVESWFYTLTETGDTLKTKFSCDVIYDQKKIGYMVKNLEMKEN